MAQTRNLSIIAYLICLCAFGISSLEFTARAIWKSKYADWLQTSVNPFGYIDRTLLLERYHPGYKRTIRQLLIELQRAGKTIGYEQVKYDAEAHGLPLDSVAFQINRFGLKGPDISETPARDVTRIMTIGDSCTFGPYIDTLSYPRILESLLNGLPPSRFEVVNAGHLGYNLYQVDALMDEWLSLEPDVITIYVGWNRTILRADPRKLKRPYETSAFYRLYYHFVVNRADTDGVNSLFTQTFSMDDPLIRDLEKARFDVDIAVLDRIVRKIRARPKRAKLYLVTLAGLFDVSRVPTSEEIAKGYAVAFTPNLAAWAALTAQYNRQLREYALDRGLLIADFEKEARNEFVPRSDFFVDSVHLSPAGNRHLAALLSKAIRRDLATAGAEWRLKGEGSPKREVPDAANGGRWHQVQ